eukprot:TRINITY_DN8401_c0_g1_i2.p1 TRINITY_DN8401_c0_g1~~TRINITY_DN8401_c0_g1_i2.p1  ORF type:complete len:489 (+),score=120.28 TRINITY_DN8401_c0_g1_i2:26-1492(+)
MLKLTLTQKLSNSHQLRDSHKIQKRRKSDGIDYFADIVEKDIGTKKSDLKTILKGVWDNELITSQFRDLNIRLTSLRGEVSSRLWERQGNNPDDVQILAVGTVNIPQHIDSYKNYIREFNKRTSDYMLDDRQGADYSVGYDLLSRGDPDARESVLKLFNHHFNFSEDILEEMINNSAITCGGMRGLKDIADGLIFRAGDNGPHRFVQPDNSFGTWWNIIEDPDTRFKDRREIIKIGTEPTEKLHLNVTGVESYYKEHTPKKFESWYITPVGNPSGTKMSPGQLYETCKAIVKHNPDAVIILDMVYLRTCTKSAANQVMSGVNSDADLLKNIIFLESFSKSHGLCNERLGLYFSANAQLFTLIHSANVAFSAGPGSLKNYQFKALGGIENTQGPEDLHLFWRDERKSLLEYFRLSKFSHLFDENQHHITDDDIEDPCTLYIMMKTKEGITAKDVFMATGALGVDTKMINGHYIRFAVGTLTKPIYSVKN